jgi:hypothetical protein
VSDAGASDVGVGGRESGAPRSNARGRVAGFAAKRQSRCAELPGRAGVGGSLIDGVIGSSPALGCFETSGLSVVGTKARVAWCLSNIDRETIVAFVVVVAPSFGLVLKQVVALRDERFEDVRSRDDSDRLLLIVHDREPMHAVHEHHPRGLRDVSVRSDAAKERGGGGDGRGED